MRISVLSLTLMLASAAAINAGVVFDNSMEPICCNWTFAQYGPGQAQSFFSGPAGNLIDVQVPLHLSVSPAASGGLTSVYLFSDAGNTPGVQLAALGSIADSALTDSPVWYDFPTAPYALAANTEYWIELVGTVGTDSAWDWPDSGNGIGITGTYWWTSLTGAEAVDYPSSDPYSMKVTTDAVPEPATLALAGLGLAALALARRRARG